MRRRIKKNYYRVVGSRIVCNGFRGLIYDAWGVGAVRSSRLRHIAPVDDALEARAAAKCRNCVAGCLLQGTQK